jgi:ribosomal subunit interface protein
MQIFIQGKNLDIGEALRGHIERTLPTGVSKYFPDPQEGSVTISRDGQGFRADVNVHVGRDILVHGGAQSQDAYGAFDLAFERITKQLRRYKRRLRDHHRSRSELESVAAQQYVLAGEGTTASEEPVDGEPAIVAEMETIIETLSVGEAVMRMDLADLPVVMFRNRTHGGLNVVYRRADGNVGWIDPRLVNSGEETAPAAPQAQQG